MIWCDNRVDEGTKEMLTVYPDGVHTTLAEKLLPDARLLVSTATMEQPYHGLPDHVLDDVDVLVWWAHMDHELVDRVIVDKIVRRILEDGMGFVALHSSHFSMVFKQLMGTTCNLKWRHGAEMERIWVVNPAHPVAQDLPEYIEIPEAEMYGERFDIPTPDELVFISWFAGGEIFRSGCAYNRGRGRIFYFRPGHGTYRIYDNPIVMKIISNAIIWANRSYDRPAEVYFGEHEVISYLR